MLTNETFMKMYDLFEKKSTLNTGPLVAEILALISFRVKILIIKIFFQKIKARWQIFDFTLLLLKSSIFSPIILKNK